MPDVRMAGEGRGQESRRQPRPESERNTVQPEPADVDNGTRRHTLSVSAHICGIDGHREEPRRGGCLSTDSWTRNVARLGLFLVSLGLLLLGLVQTASAQYRGGSDAVWDAEVQLTDSAFDEYTQWSGQHNVVVDPSGRIHVVWTVEDYFLPVPFQVFYKRYNPGSGWTADTCISEDLMARNLYCRFPSIVNDAGGDVHVVWVARGTAAADSCIYYKRCTPVGNGNGGWQDTALVITSLPATESKLTPDIACSPNGHVHVVWSHTSTATNGIRYRESTDGGSTWLAEVAVFDTAMNGANQVSPTVACAQNNTVHVAWCGHPYVGEAYHLYYRKRINTTWMPKEIVVGFTADQYEPSIVCNPLNNNPHIVCRRWYRSNWFQLTHTYWNNTWRTPQVISGSDSAYSQYDPQLAFTADGSVHVVWAGGIPGPTVKQIRYASRSPDSVWSSPASLTNATLRDRDYPSIAVAGHDLHVVWQDDRGTYQNIYYRHGYAPFSDVACTRLLVPTGTLDTGAVVTPACSLYNYDTLSVTYSVRMRIGPAYDESTTVTGHAGRSGRLVTFPDWTAGPRGVLSVACSTGLGGDLYPGNNKLTGSVTVRVRDAGTVAIVAPVDTVDSGAVVVPRAAIANFGTTQETFLARLLIGGSYSDTLTVTLAAGATDTFSFNDWTAGPVGKTAVGCSTELASDVNHSNDAVHDSVIVIPSTGIAERGRVPIVFELDEPTPNPSSGSTAIRFGIPTVAHVNLGVYSSAGSLVSTICDMTLAAGRYAVNCRLQTADCRALPSGVYVVKLRAGGTTAAQKLVVQH